MLDTNIPLMGKTPDIASSIRDFQDRKIAKEQRGIDNKRQEASDAITNSLREKQVESLDLNNLSERDDRRLKSSLITAAKLDNFLKIDDFEGAENLLQQNRMDLGQRMANGEDVDTVETDDALRMLREDPESLRQLTGQSVELGRSLGVFKSQTNSGGANGELIDRYMEDNPGASFTEALNQVKGGASAYGRLAAEIGLGGQANQAKQDGKNRSDLEYKPQISQATKEAEVIGKGRGEAKEKLESMTANMPKVEAFVAQLNQLADTATYTKSGRAFDATSRELGFEPSDGAVARAKFESVIDNQTLPLLKETFGAAFTVQEGESLKATLGDVDKSPKEKKAALEAFIEAKVGQIESLERRVGDKPQQSNSVSALDFLNE